MLWSPFLFNGIQVRFYHNSAPKVKAITMMLPI
nr:MAG TPA: hypothetical protein [Caudoviricetes sp.]